jgi:hypothetical protein
VVACGRHQHELGCACGPTALTVQQTAPFSPAQTAFSVNAQRSMISHPSQQPRVVHAPRYDWSGCMNRIKRLQRPVHLRGGDCPTGTVFALNTDGTPLVYMHPSGFWACYEVDCRAKIAAQSDWPAECALDSAPRPASEVFVAPSLRPKVSPPPRQKAFG